MKKYVIGNWKMFKNAIDAKSFITCFKAIIEDNYSIYDQVNCGVAGNFLVLPWLVKNCPPNLQIYAQNCHFNKEGAFTGEISYKMLQDINVSRTLVGHSERRHIFGERNAMISNKVACLIRQKFSIILCVGETLEQRGQQQTDHILNQQVTSAVCNVTDSEIVNNNLIIAYEPVWAIGSAKVASSEDISNAINIIKRTLSTLYSTKTVANIPILYGGSVNEKNATNIKNVKNVSGVLIGSASLKENQFFEIIKAFVS